MTQKKKMVILMAVVLTLGVLVAPFALAENAATNSSGNNGKGFWGRGGGAGAGICVQLTEEQKQELAPLYEQIKATRKQIIEKKLAMGVLTQEQADAAIERLENGGPNGTGMGPGGKGHRRGEGRGNGVCPQGTPGNQGSTNNNPAQ